MGGNNTRIDTLITGLSDMFDSICRKQQSKLYGGRRDHKTQAVHSKLITGAQRLPWSRFNQLSETTYRYVSPHPENKTKAKAKGKADDEEPTSTTCDVTLMPKESHQFMHTLSALGTCSVSQSGSPCIHSMKVLLHLKLFDLNTLEARITIRRPTERKNTNCMNPNDDVFGHFYTPQSAHPSHLIPPVGQATSEENELPIMEEDVEADMELKDTADDKNAIDFQPIHRPSRPPCHSRPITESQKQMSLKKTIGMLTTLKATALRATSTDHSHPMTAQAAYILESNVEKTLMHLNTTTRDDVFTHHTRSRSIPVNRSKFKSDNAVANATHHQGKSTRQKDMVDRAKGQKRPTSSSKDLGRNKKATKVNASQPKSISDVRELVTRANVKSKGVDAISDVMGERRIVYPSKLEAVEHGTKVLCEYNVRELESGIIRWAREDDLLGASVARRMEVDTAYTKKAFENSSPMTIGHLTRTITGGYAHMIGHTFPLFFPKDDPPGYATCVVVEYHKNRKYPFIVVFEDEEVMACSLEVIKKTVCEG